MTGTQRRRRRLMAAGSLAGLACLFASLIPAPASASSTRATIVFTGSATVTPGIGYPVLGTSGVGNAWTFSITNGVGLALDPPALGAATGAVGGRLRSGKLVEGAFCGASGGTGGTGGVTITGIQDPVGGTATIALNNVGWLQSAGTVILFTDNDGKLPALVVGVVSAIPANPVTGGTGSCLAGTGQDFTIIGLAASV